MGTDIIRLSFFCVNFWIMAVNHRNVTSYDRQIYSYFWPKFLNIYTSLR